MPVRTDRRWKAEGAGRISRDGGGARWSNLLGIHKALRIVFSKRSGATTGSRHRTARSATPARWMRDARRRTDRHHARSPLPRRRARRLVTEQAPVPVARVELEGRRQDHPSSFPPIDLFEDIADPADWPLLISAEQKTNPRIMVTIGNLDLVPVERRVGGNGAS